MWGANDYGQLGLGTTTPNRYSTPQFVADLAPGAGTLMKGEKIVELESGSYSTAALSNRNLVYMWGFNGSGLFGLGVSGGSIPSPRRVEKLTGPFVFTVTDLIPVGLSLVMDGTTPYYTITDENGDAINLGQVWVTSEVVNGQDEITFGFMNFPSGTVRLTFRVTVTQPDLFINSAEFFDPTTEDSATTNQTFHQTVEDPEPEVFSLTVRFRELDNAQVALQPDMTLSVDQGSSVTGNPPDLTAHGWVFYGYQIDGGPIIKASVPLGIIIPNVEQDHTITYFYVAVDAPPQPSAPDTGDSTHLMMWIAITLIGCSIASREFMWSTTRRKR
jgi:hypothetical protein